MSGLVGMEELKKMIKEIYVWLYINKKREEQGLKVGKQVLYMMFKGNLGIGKMMVVCLLGKLFLNMNILFKGYLIEVEWVDLVGEYIGYIVQKMRDFVKKVFGGILFIDEVYFFVRGGEKDFGKEVIDILVKYMEDLNDKFVLILVGYLREMENFLSFNLGLCFRFLFIFDFLDYDVNELMDIVGYMMNDRQYQFSIEVYKKLKDYFMDVKYNQMFRDFSNGRYV